MLAGDCARLLSARRKAAFDEDGTRAACRANRRDEQTGETGERS